MDVVIRVHVRVETLVAALRDVFLIDNDGVYVCFGRFGVITGAVVNVRRHVNQVTGLGGDLAKALGARQSSFSSVRRFNGVNVIVVRASVIWIATHHTFKHRDDLESVFGGLAVAGP